LIHAPLWSWTWPVVTGAAGLYVLGLPVLRTRASTYIHGAAADTVFLADRSFAGARCDSMAGDLAGALLA
jgi:hypothetical protein